MALGKSIPGGGGGGGGSVGVKEEGSTIVTGASAIDFVAPNLTVTNSGGIAVVTESTYKVWDVNKPPASANSLDVEFANDSTIAAWPAAWTATAAGAFNGMVFPATEPGRLAFKNTALRGYYAALPAGDFNYAIRCGAYGKNAATTVIGIGVASANSLGSQYYGLLAGYAGVADNEWNIFTDLNNGTTYTGLGRNEAIQGGVTLWLRRVGTALTAGWSPDGRIGPELSSVTPAWSPAYLHVIANSTQNAIAFINWLRFNQTNGTRQIWGGMRTITGS